ncbi:hypothetical protein TSUD_27070 [Trifolium subterraneum]|uniref:CCT domain-containing protein n=1 Tax=Trifolium subterraneum TaxID=3900 RepID=A0A2Z6LZP9_TRISU|nr:hypothetical protein TSUD_27070 [Trifolium subterraneum]
MLFTFPLYHFSQDEISSPLSARIFELCNPELFPEALQNSEFHNPNDSVTPLLGPSLSLPPVFEEDCITSVPSYVPLNPSSPSCNYLSPAGMASYMPPPPGSLATSLSDSAALFGGNMLLGSELQTQELDYQGDNGRMYCPDPIQRVFNPPDLQALNTENQQLVVGSGSSASLTPEISNLEDSTFKVGKLSVEQRKEKIHRYMKKRNERNFSKKIKVAVKEEDDMVDSSDIFAHISGVNSFKCNYSIQSWI